MTGILENLCGNGGETAKPVHTDCHGPVTFRIRAV